MMHMSITASIILDFSCHILCAGKQHNLTAWMKSIASTSLKLQVAIECLKIFVNKLIAAIVCLQGAGDVCVL